MKRFYINSLKTNFAAPVFNSVLRDFREINFIHWPGLALLISQSNSSVNSPNIEIVWRVYAARLIFREDNNLLVRDLLLIHLT